MNAPDPCGPAVTMPAAHFIGNRCLETSTGLTLPMTDPSDGEAFAEIARGSDADVDTAVRAARCAFDGAWGALAPADKGRLLGLLRDVPPLSRIACEEVFGPPLVAIPFTDEADAVRLANATGYGLVAGVWTRDGGRQLRLARAIRSRQVFINGYGAGGGVELPFGGVKHSGYGREKGFEALHGFTTLKTVVLRHG
jgi:acyl-CoA reductase-like NAD-dependent aldehyde dehydrogenase